MKNTSTLTALLTCSAFVTIPCAQPESDIAIPAEKAEITQGAPDLGLKEKENWQRLREERKRARQQILSDIKASAQAEIKAAQQEIVQQKTNLKNQNENKGIARENLINKEKGPHEKDVGEWEKHKPEFPQIDIPRPVVHDPMPFPKGPKI
ncbi:MAG: hypothetical protein J6W51_08595 [Fibrobacter sp.]|nr:hypothetical protein [Fibrobacter sp.]